MKPSIFDMWSKMIANTSASTQWMQDAQKMTEQNMQAMQTMTDAMSMISTRMRQEGQDMMDSYMETWNSNMSSWSNASNWQIPQTPADWNSWSQQWGQTWSGTNQPMPTMTRWCCNWASRGTENWTETFQVMSKSSMEAQSIMAKSYQNMIQASEKQFQNSMKGMTSFSTPSNTTGVWGDWTTETTDWFAKNASDWMKTSQNWWSDMGKNVSDINKATKPTTASASTASKMATAKKPATASATK